MQVFPTVPSPTTTHLMCFRFAILCTNDSLQYYSKVLPMMLSPYSRLYECQVRAKNSYSPCPYLVCCALIRVSMSLRREAVVGLQQLQQQLQQLEKEGGPIFVLFSGDRDPQTGNSWCPDCEKGELNVFIA